MASTSACCSHDKADLEWVDEPTSTPGYRRGKRRLLGFGSATLEYSEKADRTYDYEEKYAPDEEYKEMGPSARVWKVYLDESKRIDEERVEEWRDILDVVLVLSSIFTWIVAVFVSRTFQSLRINYREVMTILLGELLEINRAIADGNSVDDIARSVTDFTARQADLWVNGLWFTSFALSLLIAIIAMLAKQWLREYTSYTSGDARDCARIRQFRSMALEKWRVPQIIGALPFLMHFTLALFYVGLVIFLYGFSTPMAASFASMSAAMLIFYVATTMLPVVYSNCPYKTTMSSYTSVALTFLQGLYRRSEDIPTSKTAIDTTERKNIAEEADDIDLRALTWLHKTTENDSVRNLINEVFRAQRVAPETNAQGETPLVSISEEEEEPTKSPLL